MMRWLDRVEAMASGSGTLAVERHAEPLPHEQYLWDTGFHWGEWLEPGGEPSDFLSKFIAQDKSDVATAFYAWSTRHAAHRRGAGSRRGGREVRRAVGARRRRLAHGVRLSRRPCLAAHPGHTGARTDLRAGARRAPAASPTTSPPWWTRRATTWTTGSLATPDLLPALADHGHLDAAYRLLFQDSEPPRLTMIDRGATTMWERWNGIDADGVLHESLNHYSKGAVISFLHRYVAVAALEPTWRRFRVEPMPGGGITRRRPSTCHRTADRGVWTLGVARAVGHRPARLRRRGGAAARFVRMRPGTHRSGGAQGSGVAGDRAPVEGDHLRPESRMRRGTEEVAGSTSV